MNYSDMKNMSFDEMQTNSQQAEQLASNVVDSGKMSVEQSLQLLQSEEARNIVSSTLDGIKSIVRSGTDLQTIQALLPQSEINATLAQNGQTIASAIIMLVLVYSVFQGVKNSIMIPIMALVGSVLTFFVWVNSIPFLEKLNIFAWLEDTIRDTLGNNNGIFSFIDGGVEGLVMALGWFADGWGIIIYVIVIILAEKVYFSFSRLSSNNYIIDGAIVALTSRVPFLAANTFFTVKVFSIFLSVMTTYLISSALFYVEFREGAWLMRYTNIEENSTYMKLLETGRWFYNMVDINGFSSFF